MAEEHDPRGKFPLTYEGAVVDNVDPLGLHRVRIDVFDVTRESAWARPITMGGGSPQRGGHVAPAIGASVAVRFLGGDIEKPIYEALGWAPKTPPLVEGDPQGEAPAALRAAAPNQAHLVQSLQIGPLELVVDERPGQRAAIVRDVSVDDCFIRWDLETKALSVEMRSAIVIRSVGSLVLDAIMMRVKRRLVLPAAKAIG
jgi:hypothetical protein